MRSAWVRAQDRKRQLEAAGGTVLLYALAFAAIWLVGLWKPGDLPKPPDILVVNLNPLTDVGPLGASALGVETAPPRPEPMATPPQPKNVAPIEATPKPTPAPAPAPRNAVSLAPKPPEPKAAPPAPKAVVPEPKAQPSVPKATVPEPIVPKPEPLPPDPQGLFQSPKVKPAAPKLAEPKVPSSLMRPSATKPVEQPLPVPQPQKQPETIPSPAAEPVAPVPATTTSVAVTTTSTIPEPPRVSVRKTYSSQSTPSAQASPQTQTAPAAATSSATIPDESAPARPPASRVFRGSEKGNALDTTFGTASVDVGRNLYAPIYLYMPLPAAVGDGVFMNIPSSKSGYYSASARRETFKSYYAKTGSTWRLKKQVSLGEQRPGLWEILEDAGYELETADYKYGKGLKPVVIAFAVGPASGSKTTLAGYQLDSSSGSKEIDEAVVYGFSKSAFFNRTGKAVSGNFTYRFDEKGK